MKKTFVTALLFFALAVGSVAQAQSVCVYSASTGICSPSGCDPRCGTISTTNNTGSTGPVSCSTPGADPGTCIPSGSGTLPTSATTPTAPTPSTASAGCPNGGQMVNGTCNLGYTPLEPIPGLTTANGSTITFPALLNGLFTVLLTVGALFSVLMITISGVRYMLSDVVTDKSLAKKRIQAALWGLLLIAGAWLILHTINPQLLNFTLNPGSGSAVAPTQTSNTANGASVSTNPTVLYTNQTACEGSGNVWMQDSQTCIPPISQTLSNIGSQASNYLTTGNGSGNASLNTQAGCSTAGGKWTPSILFGSYSSYCQLP